MQLQQAVGHERLADRANFEKVLRFDGDVRFRVSEAVGRDALHSIAIGHDQSHPRCIHGPHVLRDESI